MSISLLAIYRENVIITLLIEENKVDMFFFALGHMCNARRTFLARSREIFHAMHRSSTEWHKYQFFKK